MDLEQYMNESDRLSDVPPGKVCRVPFGYLGGKSKSTVHILPHLPYTDRFIEPFGGSGAVLLAREPVEFEVLNDRYQGVVAFYRCIRDKSKMQRLIKRLELTLHSREEFVWCKETWENCEDDVERAARWYYMIRYSFAQIGQTFGRATKYTHNPTPKSFQKKLKNFPQVQERLKHVLIENQDWEQCMWDFDTPTTVFYLDPPYLSTNQKYEHKFDDYYHLIDVIFSMKGFVALSGYSNPIFENQNWDECITWSAISPIQGTQLGEKKSPTIEHLWIKEAI